MLPSLPLQSRRREDLVSWARLEGRGRSILPSSKTFREAEVFRRSRSTPPSPSRRSNLSVLPNIVSFAPLISLGESRVIDPFGSSLLRGCHLPRIRQARRCLLPLQDRRNLFEPCRWIQAGLGSRRKSREAGIRFGHARGRGRHGDAPMDRRVG